MTAAFSVGLCGEKYGQSFVFRNFITSPGLKKPAIKNFVQKTGRNYYMISWAEIVLRLSLASLFGALIGLERERRHWAAGLRTHMMVCVGSCLVMIVSAFGFTDVLGTSNTVLDPSRIAAQVISGIGFIGAGAILLLKQGTIRGLTTASGLWTVAAIGLATGGGMYFAAGITSFIALIILWALKPLERMYFKKSNLKTLQITATPSPANNELIKSLLESKEVSFQNFSIKKENDELIFIIELDKTDATIIQPILQQLKTNSSVKEISWS